MELYTKESLKEVIEKSKDEFYMPKALFDHYKSLRLETKLAYVSILETMKNKAGYTTENTAYIKVDNPQIQVNLAILANKEVDQEKVNVNGGAIALGHPIGASGCRVLVSLLHEMIKRDAKKGLATLCIGGGMGVALTIER